MCLFKKPKGYQQQLETNVSSGNKLLSKIAIAWSSGRSVSMSTIKKLEKILDDISRINVQTDYMYVDTLMVPKGQGDLVPLGEWFARTKILLDTIRKQL